MALSPLTIAARAKAMRTLSDDQREAAIAGADNVIGFDRFCQSAKQVQLSRAYRSPKNTEA